MAPEKPHPSGPASHTTLLLWTLAALIGCWLDFAGLQFTESPRLKLDNLAVEASGPADLSLPESLRHPADLKRIEVEFDALATSDAYPNFFQTSDGPDGLRLELASPGQLHLVVGEHDYPANYPLIVSDYPLNQWHHVRVVIEPTHRAIVELDGRRVFSSRDPTLLKPMLALDSIAVGVGFARQRPFVGEIRNFSLRATREAPRGLPAACGILGIGTALVFLLPRLSHRLVSMDRSAAVRAFLALTTALLLLPRLASVATRVSRMEWPLLSTALISLAAWALARRMKPKNAPGSHTDGDLIRLLPCVLGCAALEVWAQASIIPWSVRLVIYGLVGIVFQGGPAWLGSPARQGPVRWILSVLVPVAGGWLLTQKLPSDPDWHPLFAPGAMACLSCVLAAPLAGALRLVWDTLLPQTATVRIAGPWAVILGAWIAGLIQIRAHILPADTFAMFYDGMMALAVWFALLLAGNWVARQPPRIRWSAALVAGAVAFVLLATFGLLAAYRSQFPPEMLPGDRLFAFDEIGAIHQSNLSEAVGFFTSTLPATTLGLCLIVPLFFASAAGRLGFGYQPPPRHVYLIRALLLGVLMIFLFMGAERTPGLYRLAEKNYQQLQALSREFDSYVQARRNAPKPPVGVKPTRGETYVLVLGESANPNHMQAYGYARPTTPWLAEKAAEPGWLFFRHAYASYCHTVPSLMMALTGANQYNGADDFTAASLIDVFKAAGFKTYWLSEQGVSWTDSPLNAIASGSDLLRFVRPVGNIPALLDTVLPSVDPAENNLIVMHLIGSHAPYSDRVPAGYTAELPELPAVLAQAREADRPGFVGQHLDPYDTSIHFTDHMLQEIHARVSRRFGQVDAFVYTADHGEDVLQGNFHHASKFTYPMVRIPLVTALSPRWQERYPERYATLAARQTDIFTLDLLFELMTALADIPTPLREARLDLSDAAYAIGPHNALTMTPSAKLQTELYVATKPLPVAADPWLITTRNIAALERQYPARFIRNHADAYLAPAETRQIGMSGLEINVTMPTLMVGHYPEVKSDYPLADWLTINPPHTFAKLWLDMKTIPANRLSDGLPGLEQLDARHGIKAFSLVESWEPDLDRFTQAGWHTSYYLHDANWPAIASHDAAELAAVAARIAPLLQGGKVNALSFHARYYSFVKTHLEPLLPPDIVYHTWAMDIPALSDPDFLPVVLVHPITADPRVKTILLPFPADTSF